MGGGGHGRFPEEVLWGETRRGMGPAEDGGWREREDGGLQALEVQLKNRAWGVATRGQRCQQGKDRTGPPAGVRTRDAGADPVRQSCGGFGEGTIAAAEPRTGRARAGLGSNGQGGGAQVTRACCPWRRPRV